MSDHDSLKNFERTSNSSEQAGFTGGKAPLDKVVALRLNVSDWEKLEAEARELGVGPTTLIRKWILERLHRLSEPQQDTLGTIELFLRRAFREGVLLQTPMGEKQARTGLRETILLQTPREMWTEPGKQGSMFYGNIVID